ncbi:hypothetical protein K469DRAFT_629751 [Zopfia rhizophila CBS 207.26]|uniref:DUF202 domain-containing protein n=1 Tax=Zopfia rhizophila CBS 207.26 TaxID=1314779 RepID=A0A6A6E8X0_9PEZI|nr:hypothetical protein K469DRAFT_629751 [Zopfia rhizophila CBS 207.26]
MNDPDSPPRAPPLELPLAVLHSAPSPPHPDSEEFRQSDRYRTAQELESVALPKSSSSKHLSPNALHPLRSPSLRSRGNSIRSSPFRGGLARRNSEISTVADSLGPEGRDERRHQLRRQVPHWHDPIVKFWKTQVSITIDEGSHRDHLALERTYLGYLRTSLALAVAGVLTAQLFRLQHTVNPNPNFGFFVLGIPLAATFIAFGLVVLLIGAWRFWRQQNAMIRGKVYAGGWEVTMIMVLSVIVSGVLLFYLIFS